MFETLRKQLAGVVAIPVTPFGSDGKVDCDAYTRIISRMVETGIEVITPNGNTSEFYSLTAQERQTCLELSVAAVGLEDAVLAGVGHSVSEAVEAAEAAYQAGARDRKSVV